MRTTTNVRTALERLADLAGVGLEPQGRAGISMTYPHGVSSRPHSPEECLAELQQNTGLSYKDVQEVTGLVGVWIPAGPGRYEPRTRRSIPGWVDNIIRRILVHDPDNPNRADLTRKIGGNT